MTTERYRQIKPILEAALDLGPAERAALLDETCAGDPELRRESESLLSHLDESGEFLESPIVAEDTLPPSRVLCAGDRLGPYEIAGVVGAGGMGEVYRARDSRLDREVAIKVLPAVFSGDPEWLQRFQREARAAGSLNHPNVLTIHDVGCQDSMHYLVAELLEGETLRQRLKSSVLLPIKAVGIAVQVARGLGAAHSRGVIHRDLKPENIFLTRDGTVKILDFGLAKLLAPLALEVGKEPAEEAETLPGVVMGSAGYMSPEQASGLPADQRADIFSLGAILYEMLSGARCFSGATWIEVTHAVLKKPAPDLPSDLAGISDARALGRIVHRCLEKRPDDRFQSARDLAFALESALERSGNGSGNSRFKRWIWPAIAASLFIAAALLTAYRLKPLSLASFQRVTFRRGAVSGARFTADGNTIIYSAAWDGAGFQLYSTRPDGPESRSLGIEGALLLDISSQGEMALCLPTNAPNQHVFSGVLATVPIGGGGLRERAVQVSSADWSPDGAQLAAVVVENGRFRVEYPLGRVLYRAAGYIEQVRVSPRGDYIGFIEHPLQEDSAGFIKTVDLLGNARTLSSRFNSSRGLAWSADGKELWFSAAKKGLNPTLSAVSLSGVERTIAHFPAYVSIEDISRSGSVLLSAHAISGSMVHVKRAHVNTPVAESSTNLYWHDESQVQDISGDGKTILFAESGDATGADYEAYIRRTDGSPAVRLGAGLPVSFSPDGKWAIANPAGVPAQLTLLPTGAGEPRGLTADEIDHVGAAWMADRKGFVFAGSAPGHGLRYYAQSFDGSAPRPITAEGVRFERLSPVVLSPDAKSLAAVDRNGRIALYLVSGGEPHGIPGLESGYTPLRWCRQGELILQRTGELRARLWKVGIATGQLALWTELAPPNPVGLIGMNPIRISPDCESYIYSPLNVLSDVYVADALR